jgi:thioesterase domain-containing protein
MSPSAQAHAFGLAILPGAGGGAPNVAAFAASDADLSRMSVIRYPGWTRYLSADFSADALIRELASDIASRAPTGSIGLIGVSLGGHFGYAVALQLQAMGRDVAGLCAVDSFMVTTAAATPGWGRRHFARALGYLRQGSFERLSAFVRSLFWRALMRLAGGRAPMLLRRFQNSGWLRAALARNPAFEAELSMRLLMREVAPWMALLDRDPAPLSVPCAFLRIGQTAGDDPKWRRRCPNIEIVEIPGDHEALFDPGNIEALREAFLGATRRWR